MGRCLGVIGIKGKDMLPIMCVPVICAFVSLWIMQLIIAM
jgi:spore maturation protein SpmB